MNFPAVFDNSMVSSFKKCPHLCKEQYFECWQPKLPSVHLLAGAAFAKGLEAARTAFFVEQRSSAVAINCGLTALAEAYGDYQPGEGTAKTKDRMLGALEFYFMHYPLETAGSPVTYASGKRGIEFSFALPIDVAHPETGDPIIYCGRMDAILDYGGGIYIVDEKTTTSLGATWGKQWDLRSQFSGYIWGARHSGIMVTGAIVRGVSILKTKYDTQQSVFDRPDWQIDRWYNELLQWIEQIKACYKSGNWLHNLDNACADFGGCSFRDSCLSATPQDWLERDFERRRWDPLARTEAKL